MFAKTYEKKRNILASIHDILMMVLALGMQVIIMNYTIREQLLKGNDLDIDF